MPFDRTQPAVPRVLQQLNQSFSQENGAATQQMRTANVAGGRQETSAVLFGDTLRRTAPTMNIPDPILYLKGVDGSGNRVNIPMGKDLLSRHVMLLGGIGTGKTNAFFQMMDQIIRTQTENDIMIVFDTKGDFYQEFFEPGDVVISNDATAVGPEGELNYWNIFNEVSGGSHQYESVMEIAKSLFAEAVEKTNQIFFPSAARDIFMGLMLHFLRSVEPKKRTNKNLVEFINYHTTAEIREVLESHRDLRAMASYISKDDSAQTQGVMSELQQVVRNIFVGNFAKTGTLGISRLVRKKGGRIIFIEYDLSLGEMLTPIYSLMFDMAIKEALGRSRSEGNVYFITDEFRLLPHLEHVDDAVNFGRSLGIKFMIGIQNVQQIFENYGEQRARSIMSGFLTSFNFRVNDAKSREYIQEAFGKNQKIEAYVPIVQSRGMVEQQREANVVEDWDVTNLHIGEAIIGFPGMEPFTLQFDQWGK
ncbi:MAG: type IV secretion system DNA-binding domain-containing protein [Prevotella sp.]|nr:type IV secretion system DNA-binding domain-containing protein [Prevotella sp.]